MKNELKKLLQEQYIKEFKLRKRIAVLLAITSLFITVVGHFVVGENSCIFVISAAFCVITLLPLPKGWKDRVMRNSRKPVYATIKCIGTLFAYTLNILTVNWAPVSWFGLVLAIYGAAITPYLERIKKPQ